MIVYTQNIKYSINYFTFELTSSPNQLDPILCLKCFILTATSITVFYHFICFLSFLIFFLNSWQCAMLILKSTTTAPKYIYFEKYEIVNTCKLVKSHCVNWYSAFMSFIIIV